jgi:hypothetical protein
MWWQKKKSSGGSMERADRLAGARVTTTQSHSTMDAYKVLDFRAIVAAIPARR